MEIALIPPYSQLQHLHDRQFQMMLPACLSDDNYRQTFSNVEVGDKYVIMDNGMFEDKNSLSVDSLIALINRWVPNEIVMPDARDDADKTFSLVADFLYKFEHSPSIETTDLMIVMQVKHFEEVPRFLQAMTKMEENVFVGQKQFTIGIPRRMTEGRMGGSARANVVDWIHRMGLHNPIHLLGYSRREAAAVYNETLALWSSVRSMDTDAQFVWAYNLLEMNTNRTPPERGTNYMMTPDGYLPEYLVRQNIDTLDGWAHGNA